MNATTKRSTLGRGISRLDKKATPTLEYPEPSRPEDEQSRDGSWTRSPVVRDESSVATATGSDLEAVESTSLDVDADTPTETSCSTSEPVESGTEPATGSDPRCWSAMDDHRPLPHARFLSILALTSLVWAPVACFLCWFC